MEYEQHQIKFEKENRWLRIGIVSSLIMFSITLYCVSGIKSRFYAISDEIFDERGLASAVCHKGFVSIVEDRPNDKLVSQGILDILKKEPFLMKIDNIIYMKSIEENYCKIILSSEGELLAYRIGLASGADYSFEYKINSIDEIKAEEGQI